MNWCRFSTGGETSFGMVQDDSVVKVEAPVGQHAVDRADRAA